MSRCSRLMINSKSRKRKKKSSDIFGEAFEKQPSSSHPNKTLECKFRRLASLLARSVHFYGLSTDVGPLLGKPASEPLFTGSRPLGSWLNLCLVLGANLVASYVLCMHLVFEYYAHETRIKELANSGLTGWAMLKELFENLRRHLSRVFTVALVLAWHLSCSRLNRLFADCRRYYSLSSTLAIHVAPSPHQYQSSKNTTLNHTFYLFSRRRILLALSMPLFHFLFNMSTSLLNQQQQQQLPTSSAPTKQPTLLEQAEHNFHSFHLAMRTSFHPINEQQAAHLTLGRSLTYCLLEMLIYSLYFHGPRLVCATCLSLVLHLHSRCLHHLADQLERLIHRPREQPLTSADLSRLLKHYNLIGQMHERIETTFKCSILIWFSLMFISCLMHIFSLTDFTSASILVAQAAGSPAEQLSSSSTTSAASSANVEVAASLNGTVGGQQQQQLQRSGPPATGRAGAAGGEPAPLTATIVRFASAFFVCYSPALIYLEAFKIEAASGRIERLVTRLARRPADPLAQSLELSLFEPLCLSVGDYFHVSKRSMSSLLGALVTFSVMFIATAFSTQAPQDWTLGPLLYWHLNDNWQQQPEYLEEEKDQEEEQPDNELEADEGDEAKEDEELSVELGANSSLWQVASRRKPQEGNQGEPRATSSNTGNARLGAIEAPHIADYFEGLIRENDRLVELEPALHVLNQAEVCDFEVMEASGDVGRSKLAFIISYIDRVSGRASLEARSQSAVDCESQSKYTLRLRAIGCNGLPSNEALATIQVEDVNEFSPEFERQLYKLTWSPELVTTGSKWTKLLKVVAQDGDCSNKFGSICRYELEVEDKELAEWLVVDLHGQIQVETEFIRTYVPQKSYISFQVIAFDCGGRNSTKPTRVQINFPDWTKCTPGLKNVEASQIYPAGSGELSPLRGAQLELCGAKCSQINISVTLEPRYGAPSATSGPTCDKLTYSVVSRRRLCGDTHKIIELLPSLSPQTKWTLPIQKSSRHLETSQTSYGDHDNNESEAAELEPEEGKDCQDSSLNAYAPAGVYGRAALRASQDVASSLSSPQSDALEMPEEWKRMNVGNKTSNTTDVGGDRVDPQMVHHDQVYWFDGKTSVVIPRQIYREETSMEDTSHRDQKPLFGSKHSLSFLMRRSNTQSHLSDQMGNENILCWTAPRIDSIPHPLYSLYLFQCQLRLLIAKPTKYQYEPLERRWSIDTTCDNKWHSYTVEVNEEVHLYVDGQLWNEENSSSRGDEEEWSSYSESDATLGEEYQSEQEEPLLALGACWDPRQRFMKGYFRGQLKAITVLPDINEEPSVIECINQCTESLLISNSQVNIPTILNDTATSVGPSLVVHQESSAKIQLSGYMASDVGKALKQVSYLNTRPLPSLGQRLIRADLRVSGCSEELQQSMEPFHIRLSVAPAPYLPQILIRGAMPNLVRNYQPLMRGIHLFRSVSVTSRLVNLRPSAVIVDSKDERMSFEITANNLSSHTLEYLEVDKLAGNGVTSQHARVEACSIRVQPTLNAIHERLELPLGRLRSLGLYWRLSQEGASIYGLDSVKNYQRILRAIVYRNKKPAFYQERLFKLVCSDMNGGLVSNEYLQTVTVVHHQVDAAIVPSQQHTPQAQSLKQTVLPSLEYTEQQMEASALINGGSDQLDRLAMAFMVFILSLIAMMLVIALANLRSGSGRDIFCDDDSSKKPSELMSSSDSEDGDFDYEQPQHLVVNPILHGPSDDANKKVKSLISVQRPDSKGAMTKQPRSQVASEEESIEVRWNKYEEVVDLKDDAEEEETGEHHQMCHYHHHNYCSDSYSSSSESSSEEENETDLNRDAADKHLASGHMCAFHAIQSRKQSINYTTHYELYHKHHPHHHHYHQYFHRQLHHHSSCLKSIAEQRTFSNAAVDCEATSATDYETDSTELVSCISAPATLHNPQ